MLKPQTVHIAGVSKVFTNRLGVERTVLADTDLEIASGDVVSIVGPTGCGKTTLLNVLAGFEEPTSGEVRVGGTRVTGPGPDRGVMFQQPNLLPWLNLRENVAFPAKRGRGLAEPYATSKELYEEVDRVLGQVHLGDSSDHFPYQVSGGMQARAALARLFHSRPSILLMDEPFGALDAITRSVMHKLFLNILGQNEHRRSVLFITHDIEEAISLSDYVYVMSRAPGKLVKKIEIPFGRSRDYDEVRNGYEIQKLRVEILEALTPYITGGH